MDTEEQMKSMPMQQKCFGIKALLHRGRLQKNRPHVTTVVFAVLLLMAVLGGCGKRDTAAPPPVSAQNAEIETSDEPAEATVMELAPGRQDGERFEEVIILEGMEETVRYEHVRNSALGFEIDYDYESFVRHSEADRERFVSCWDDAENPENYLEVKYSPQDAETAAADISAALSNEYEIGREDSFMLARAGRCIRIDASEVKGGGYMPEHLQTVYIIPAGDGCHIATVHSGIVESEGFGRRFRYMMDTFEH